MTGTTAEFRGVGLTCGPIRMIARSPSRLARAAAARSGMVMNVMMMDVNVQSTCGGVPARAAGIKRETRWRDTAGNQGLQKSGTTPVPSVVLGASTTGAIKSAGHGVMHVRLRGQRSGAGVGDIAARSTDGDDQRLGPSGRGGRQSPNKAGPRAGSAAARGNTRLTLHAVPGIIHRSGGSSSPFLPMTLFADGRSGRAARFGTVIRSGKKAWPEMGTWSGRRIAVDSSTCIVHRGSLLFGPAALRLSASTADT